MANQRPMFFNRRFLVDSRSQMAILAYTFFVSAMTVLLTMVFFQLVKVLAMQPSLGAEEGATKIAVIAVGASFIAIFLLFLLGFVVSNRIAGPVYRLRTHMQKVAAGETVEPISFRKKDQFFEMADDYNRVLERLQRAEGTLNKKS